MKILLTTPDYPPKLGGLSTLTVHIENSLKKLASHVDVFVWKSVEEISNISHDRLSSADVIVNIHFNFGLKHTSFQRKMINIVHGSEVLITSPNIIKKLIKKILAFKYLEILERSKFNVFISYATQRKAYQVGLKSNYERDLVFHNCVETSKNEKIEKSFNQGPLIFVLMARNVPHKNFAGTKKFLLAVKKLSGRDVVIHTPHPHYFEGCGLISIKSGSTEQEKEESFKAAHFNLLFSLDHSHRGFYEGFGLTILEAGLWGTPSLVLNTGGLGEAVHHKITGHVFESLEAEEIKRWWLEQNEERWNLMSAKVYEHTVGEHSLEMYDRLFRGLII